MLAPVFSAGVLSNSREPEAARALIRFLASPAAAPAITESGMEALAPMELEPVGQK